MWELGMWEWGILFGSFTPFFAELKFITSFPLYK